MLFAGIDWSDQALDFHLRSADGAVLAQGRVRPTMEGLADLGNALEVHGQADRIHLAIEATNAAWVQTLLDRGYHIYPLNPKMADSFREALSAAGDKCDRIDARVLAQMVANLHQQLRPLQPDDPQIVTLRIACQDRVRLVYERTAKLNELRAVLKAHYPAFLECFDDLDTQIALDFLTAFPTQQALRSMTPRRLAGWLRRHHYPRPERVDDIVSVVTRPVLPVAKHLQLAKAPLIAYLVKSLTLLRHEIVECEAQITRCFESLPEAPVLASLPGAGPTLAPALLACVGRDPRRFADVSAARAFMGTAPVTKASGRVRSVHFRRACWKFARRTLQLFADRSRHYCEWAQTCYQRQRERGHSHHSAIRALAHKWLKIILAMKRTGTPYDEHKFTHSQLRYLLNAKTSVA